VSKPVVYLAGLISTGVPQSLQWRLAVSPRLELAGFEVLSPMRGTDPSGLWQGGLVDPSLSPKDVVLRDFKDVKRSTVILAHLDNFGGDRPLLGTIAELAWAWQFQTPVVGVAELKNIYMRTHPFVREFITHYCFGAEEAVDFIVNYYGGS